MKNAPRYVGTAKLGKAGWSIDCEPHVRIRLRRVFGKMNKRQYDSIRISDTPENARDLEWFCERYPLELKPKDAAHLKKRADGHRHQQETIANILSGEYTPRAHELAIPARDYQLVAADMLLATGGLLLADDVGTGKTASAICTFTDANTLPALVVTLAHLPRQWEAEINRFLPSLNVHIIRNGDVYDLGATKSGQLVLGVTLPDVIIINYHKLAKWADHLAPHIKSIVFDECQELRHSDSQRYGAAEHLAKNASYKMGLSATPFYNYGGEMWNVLDVLRPGVVGTREEFGRDWCNGTWSEKSPIGDPRAFGGYVRGEGIMLRRTRADIGRELPAFTRAIQEVDADTSELDKVADRASALARLILGGSEQVKGEKWRAAEELSHLVRQATGIAKAPYVADFVRILLESGEKVVLYGWHRAVYDIWLERLKEFAPILYTGTESPTQKHAAKESFVKGGSRVLVISLRSGAGLDGLQRVCRTTVFGELDWSPGVHEQCEGRIYRDEQPEKVVAYYLIANSGSDPVVVDALGLKRQQIEGVKDPDRELVEKLQADPNQVKKLAAALLRQRGIEVPDAEGAAA